MLYDLRSRTSFIHLLNLVDVVAAGNMIDHWGLWMNGLFPLLSYQKSSWWISMVDMNTLEGKCGKWHLWRIWVFGRFRPNRLTVFILGMNFVHQSSFYLENLKRKNILSSFYSKKLKCHFFALRYSCVAWVSMLHVMFQRFSYIKFWERFKYKGKKPRFLLYQIKIIIHIVCELHHRLVTYDLKHTILNGDKGW